jgi:mono/diheme cytochrome c family protein
VKRGLSLAGLLAALASIGISCTNMQPASAPPQTISKAERRELFRRGAELWPVKCMQCHNARPGSEFTPEQWQMILMHMRTLANLPPQDAQAVYVYLQGGRQ